MSYRRNIRSALLGATALAGAALWSAGPASADTRQFQVDTPSQPLGSALQAFGRASDEQLIFSEALVQGRTAPALKGAYTVEDGLKVLLAGTGLVADHTPTGVIKIRNAAESPQGESAGGGADTNVVQELVVTAQKKSENIQVVPIAISAFTQQDLTTRQVAGGPDLMTQVPNMTFTKTNFSSYSIQIRGIGTQAVSATTDAAVAVAFNNSPFIRNRFFEQEFYDLERIEVLRGPQGTLYGRNATAGVVNIISAKPSFDFEAKASADIANFSSKRVEGMVNVPLVNDKVALRLAGAWTKRDGYATNQLTASPIDGRDLWSTRLSLRIEPSDRWRANLIWEHFQENDDRLRSGKQLCKKDVVTTVGNVTNIPYYSPLPNNGQMLAPWAGVQATLSQGCERNSLYASDSFQTPTGLMLPYYVPLGAIGLPIALQDPYVSTVQSPDLRVIESTIDPKYTAKSDLGEFQISFDISDALTLASETAYNADTVYSLEDYNRFNTASGAWADPRSFDRPGVLTPGPNGAVFCDPQLGCSDRLVAVDISTAKSRQFSQEFRLSSSFAGKFNFSLGANFLRYDTEDKYYVFINALSLEAAGAFSSGLYRKPYIGGVSSNSECLPNGPVVGDPNNGVYPVTGCVYIDPNPIESVNDLGHNYFLSKNPYKLISYAVFGEAYYNLTDDLKLTGGLRWTVDKKEAPRIPSWILAAKTLGYPVAEVIRQDWSQPTGRLAIDWKPDLSFTDQTLLYASYAHGYKAGGANPPGYVRVFYAGADDAQTSNQISATRPKTFAAEFVDAFEVGSKNTFADGKATLNLSAFYYDYKDYQISEIVDRSAFNRNFDATVWGVEFEGDWRPLKNLRLGLKGGYERTRIADGEKAIDLMDRTAGDPNWTVSRPFPTFASSCILPTFLFNHPGPDLGFGTVPGLYGLGGVGGGNPGGCEIAYLQNLDPVTQAPYTPDPTSGGTLWFWDPGTYHGWDPKTAPNHGEGIFKDLGGNELPNAPHWTATFTSDYTLPLAYDWTGTLHADVHWQSQSWWRVFNDHVYDKLHPYFTMNLAAIFKNEQAGLTVMAYVKNVTDETAITGAFLNSDDTGLTTNVFLTEPRLYGVRVTKEWTGGIWWGGSGREHPAGEPYPITLEIGGQIQRQDAPYSAVRPTFLDNFSQTLQPTSAQNQDLDWGDGREITLTYAVPGSAWRFSGGLRIGKANGRADFDLAEVGDTGCLFGGPDDCFPYFQLKGTNYARGVVSDREEHLLVDFMVGRDLGIGAMGMKSELKAGLRYGEFKSRTHLNIDGVPDWQVADSNAYYYNPSQHHHYIADLEARRAFKGAGPVLSWEASKRLFGQEETGHADLDWSVQGGILFGKQRTFVNGEERGAYYDGIRSYRADLSHQVGPTVITPGPAARSKSISAPTLGASVGLSFEIQRLKLGAGYRWERYFNVLDAGYAEHKTYDRSFDGPYFKVSVGFGG